MPTNANLTIKRNIPRPPRELIERFAGVPTPNIGDSQGREGAIDYRIRPVFEPFPGFVGPALTVSVLQRDNLAAHVVMEFIQPGDVLVIETHDCIDGAVFGDLMLGMYKNCGVAGIVTDGAIRDIEEFAVRGLPVFARGVQMKGPHKNGPGTIGFDVSIGGVAIRSGDIVAADANGVIVVPQDQAQETLRNLEVVLQKEETMVKQVNDGLKIMPFAKDYLASGDVMYVD